MPIGKLHKRPAHPGTYVRESIIPSDMSITSAAKRLGITRVALSNFLNGKSGLSATMAAALAKAFGADRKRLVEMQAAYDHQKRDDTERQVAVRAFVPSFLLIKARQIENWAESDISARTLLPVLLRKLVHSTSDDLLRVDFPGYDSGERKGMDGFVEAGSATPWVPLGRSYWEFGTNKNPAVKADKDYASRLKSIDRGEREDSTFVFVTPRRWTSKTDWGRDKGEAGDWKSVRAFDASDLEQWLEQSVPAQIWLAEQLQLPINGVETLDQVWLRWAHGSKPNLTPEVFAPAVAANRNKFKCWLDRPCDRPFVVAADSRLEALAFLACLFDDETLGASKKDLAAVFSSPTALKAVISSSVPFIPVVHSAYTERELADAYRTLHCITFRHRNSVEPVADIELNLLRDNDFHEALRAMGVDKSSIDRLARESGQSPTILRRRLSENPSIRRPEWASDDDAVKTLVAMSLIGVWHSDVEADQEIVSNLAGRSYGQVEREIRILLGFDDSPVWSAGRYRGVASKIDSLFAIARVVTGTDLERFFKAAEIVLSESDPALELPAEDRWAAAVYGKQRRHSDELRTGVCETLVLLSVHGNHLFQSQLGIKVEEMVTAFVRKLLTPLTTQKLLSHLRDLPYYAEAAPGAFLEMLEKDRAGDESVVVGLLKLTQADALGPRPLRIDILWALECLAWNPKYLARVSRILAWLSRWEPDDNWANKPEESLAAIFRSWMPQTAALLRQRLATLELLIKEFPEVAWKLCVDDIKPGPRFGASTYRPRWRNDASGAGQVVTNKEASESWQQVLDFLIDWFPHNQQTLGDLIELLDDLPEKYERRLWELIYEWSRKSDECAKAALRERIRQAVFTYHRGRNLESATRARALEAYDNLRSEDPVIRNCWLFENHWVQLSDEETEDKEIDDLKHDELVDKRRREAIDEIWSARGFGGIYELLSRSRASDQIGWYAASSESCTKARIDFIHRCLSVEGDLRDQADQCLQGYIRAFGRDSEVSVLRAAADGLSADELARLFACAPVQESIWRILDDYGEDVRAAYWKNVVPPLGPHPAGELTELIDNLLDARRPRAAFDVAQSSFKDVETSRLKRLLFDVATVNEKLAGAYPLQPYQVSKALDSLDGRAGVPPDFMAQLEFLFIGALDDRGRGDRGHGIPNLQAQLLGSPELFVRMVAFMYRRRDGREDPLEWTVEDPDRKQALAMAARQTLDSIKKMPGEDDNGKIHAERLTKWIVEVRQLFCKYGRVEIGDQVIGQMLARVPAGEDDTWPCDAVCHAMETIASLHIGTGFLVGVRNSRGMQMRGEGGRQERELAERYRAKAERLHFEYPNVGGVLEHIAKAYDQDADWWDAQSEKDKRLDH